MRKSTNYKLRPKIYLLIVLWIFAISNSIAQKPNVVIIFTDDQGYGDMSCHGNTMLKTPGLDKFAEQSVRFTDFHVTPMCTSSRSQLMTGIHALRNGAFLVCSGYSAIYPDIPTMPEIFKKSDYKTALFGKWHLGHSYPYRPMDRGFDHAVWHKGWGLTAAPNYWNNDYYDDFIFINDSLVQSEGYCTDYWFTEAKKWIKECKESKQPFFTYLSTNAPHGPFFVDESYRRKFPDVSKAAASYYGMIVNLDENIGKFNEFLEREGLADNTIVIFMTDNGQTTHLEPLYNAGMRGVKKSLYEGGHRVPCFIRWPAGNLRKPGEIDDLVEVRDILPTLIDLCGLKTSYNFEGKSVSNLLRGNEQPELSNRKMVIQYGRQPLDVLKLPEKYDACVMWRKWRLVHNKELYNIEEDPGQEHNIADRYKNIVKEMKRFYEEWWDKTEYNLYNKFNFNYIGAKEEPEILLSSHDFQTINTSGQFQIRAGNNRNGAWRIRVLQEGMYRFEVRRWPREAKTKMIESYPEHKGFDTVFPEGKALAISRVNVKVGVQEYT
ncbi:MAG: arylsulfatase, partial [Mariniphaga sp.]